MKIERNLTDSEVFSEIGARIRRIRLDTNVSQGGLAAAAGVSLRTIQRIETGGEGYGATSLLRVLRGLGLLENLGALLPETGCRPMEMLRNRGKPRERAGKKRKGGGPWRWGE